MTSYNLDLFVPGDKKSSAWDIPALNAALRKQFGAEIKDELIKNVGDLDKAVTTAVKNAYENQKGKMGDVFPQLEKMVLLRAIDQHWKEHLRNMDALKEGINLRSFAQKDPLIEYKKEAFVMFEELDRNIKSEALERIFRIQVVAQEDINQMEEDLEQSTPGNLSLNDPSQNLEKAFAPVAQPRQSQNRMSFSHSGEEREKVPAKAEDGPGRNDACPCGSGKKYKKCHGAGK